MTASGKSSPMTPTRRTGQKSDAAMDAYVAAPPTTFSKVPRGHLEVVVSEGTDDENGALVHGRRAA